MHGRPAWKFEGINASIIGEQELLDLQLPVLCQVDNSRGVLHTSREVPEVAILIIHLILGLLPWPPGRPSLLLPLGAGARGQPTLGRTQTKQSSS